MPLPPPPHHPESVDEKPISPPLESLRHNKPPKKNKLKSLLGAVIVGTLISFMIGFTLDFMEVSINVILPVLVPVWIGTITLTYSVNMKN